VNLFEYDKGHQQPHRGRICSAPRASPLLTCYANGNVERGGMRAFFQTANAQTISHLQRSIAWDHLAMGSVLDSSLDAQRSLLLGGAVMELIYIFFKYPLLCINNTVQSDTNMLTILTNS
jgi:hypothetical protein